MQIIITGANGFLGHYLTAQLLSKNIAVLATGKGDCRLPFIDDTNFTYATLDFTNADTVMNLFATYNPTVIIHAGAMSKPDECELNKENTWLTNVTGTANMLAAAAKYNCHFIISLPILFLMEQKACILKQTLPTR